MRTLILTTASLLLLFVPVASAGPGEPNCLEVYPWSELCHGDVGGFLDAVVGDAVDLPCDLKDCVTLSGLPVECMQVYPYSKLCSGDVGGFVCAMVRCEV